MISSPIPLPLGGILQAKIPSNLYKRILSECVDKRDTSVPVNNTLAGHIENEYEVKDDIIQYQTRDFVNKLIREYYVDYGYSEPRVDESPIHTPALDIWSKTENPRVSYDTFMGEDKRGYVKRWKQQRLWINYMKKHEFNPPHTHTGTFSIVMFIKIPFDIEDEEKVFPPTNTERILNYNGTFGVTACNYFGQINDYRLHIDRTWEGTMLLFPANMRHSVHPFYSSDEERITMSSNYVLDRVKYGLL